MKHNILLYSCLYFSITILAPEKGSFDYNKSTPKEANNSIVRSEFENHLKDHYQALKDKNKAISDQNKAIDYQNKISEDSSLSKKDKKTKINEIQKQIDNAQQRVEEAQQRADNAQQKARDEYEQRHNNGLSTGKFIDQNINENNIASVYGEKQDTNLLQFTTDLFNINPHLFKTYIDKSYDVKPKLKKLTDADFDNFKQYPKLLIQGVQENLPSVGDYLKRRLHASPLEESVELKDKASINKILDLIQDPKFQKKAEKENIDISLKSLTQPLIDKYMDIIREKGIKAANEYIESIEKIGVPELTNTINQQTAMLYLQWSLADGDIETATKVLSHIKNLKVKTSFIADELTKRYDYLKKYKGLKEAESFKAKVEQLGDTKLNDKFAL